MKYSNAQIQDAIAEAQKATEGCSEYFENNDVEVMSLIEEGKMWQPLTAAQKRLIKESFAP